MKSRCVWRWVLGGLLLLSGVAGKGVWGTDTGSKHKRETERVFTLPDQMMRATGKTFEELYAEAETLSSSYNQASGAGSPEGKMDMTRESMNTLRKGLTPPTQREVEIFLMDTFDKIQVHLSSPDFTKTVEDSLVRFIASFNKTMGDETVRTQLRESDVMNSLGELNEHISKLREKIPDVAEFALRELSPADLHAILQWNINEMLKDGLSTDSANFFKRAFAQSNIDFVHLQYRDIGSSLDISALLQDLDDNLRKFLDDGIFNLSDEGHDIFSTLSKDILSSPDRYMNDFRQQLRDYPLIAEMAGVSANIVSDDREWNKYAKSMKSSMELLFQKSGGDVPNMEDIFGVANPQFANILESIVDIEKAIENTKDPKRKISGARPRSRERKRTTVSNRKTFNAKSVAF